MPLEAWLFVLQAVELVEGSESCGQFVDVVGDSFVEITVDDLLHGFGIAHHLINFLLLLLVLVLSQLQFRVPCCPLAPDLLDIFKCIRNDLLPVLQLS